MFLSAVNYIRSDRPAAARSFRLTVESELSRLVDFPDSGRRIPEFPSLPFREVIVVPYRFFYRVKGDTAWVVACWHEAQLVDAPEDLGAGG
jgi:toxin ParE1/3/4